MIGRRSAWPAHVVHCAGSRGDALRIGCGRTIVCFGISIYITTNSAFSECQIYILAFTCPNGVRASISSTLTAGNGRHFLGVLKTPGECLSVAAPRAYKRGGGACCQLRLAGAHGKVRRLTCNALRTFLGFPHIRTVNVACQVHQRPYLHLSRTLTWGSSAPEAVFAPEMLVYA